MIKNSKSFVRSGKRWWLVFAIVILMAPLAGAGIADILSIFQTINRTLRQSGGLLDQIQNIRTTVTDLETKVVWPVSLIDQARNFVATNEAQARSILSSIQSLSLGSATLIHPSQLEAIARSARAMNAAQLQGVFHQVYSSVSPQGAALPLTRNMMDMDDAVAQGSLKTALASDQFSEQMLVVATGLAQQTASAAPGSAPMLNAQAGVAELENEAFTTRMVAAQLRQEAVQLAHENGLRKQGVEDTHGLRMNVQQILSQPSGGIQ